MSLYKIIKTFLTIEEDFIMALVMQNTMVADYLENKMAITSGVTTNIVVENKTHMDIITYPAQEGFENGAILALIQSILLSNVLLLPEVPM